MRNSNRRTFDLPPEGWDYLMQLARETNSRPRDGINAYQHTWQELLRRLSRGEFILTERDPKARQRAKEIKTIDEAIEKNRRRALPGQQPLFETEAEPA